MRALDINSNPRAPRRRTACPASCRPASAHWSVFSKSCVPSLGGRLVRPNFPAALPGSGYASPLELTCGSLDVWLIRWRRETPAFRPPRFPRGAAAVVYLASIRGHVGTAQSAWPYPQSPTYGFLLPDLPYSHPQDRPSSMSRAKCAAAVAIGLGSSLVGVVAGWNLAPLTFELGHTQLAAVCAVVGLIFGSFLGLAGCCIALERKEANARKQQQLESIRTSIRQRLGLPAAVDHGHTST